MGNPAQTSRHAFPPFFTKQTSAFLNLLTFWHRNYNKHHNVPDLSWSHADQSVNSHFKPKPGSDDQLGEHYYLTKLDYVTAKACFPQACSWGFESAQVWRSTKGTYVWSFSSCSSWFFSPHTSPPSPSPCPGLQWTSRGKFLWRGKDAW